MAATEDQIQLNESARTANDAYIDSLIKKAQNGVKLRDEELLAIVDYRANKNREIEINDLISRAQSGEKLGADDIKKLQDYKAGILASPKSESLNIPAQYREGFEGATVAGAGLRKTTGQDQLFAKALARIGPIANTQITDVDGDTLKVRLANKIYGPEGWTLDDSGELLVKPRGQNDFLKPAGEDIIPSLQRTGITAASGLIGETVGGIAGTATAPFTAGTSLIAGPAIGAGVGSAIGENKNIKNAIKDAVKLELIQPSEKPIFDKAVNEATAIGGGLGALFGGGTPIIKGIASATVGKTAQATGQRGLAGLKNLPQAIRVEDQSLGQGIVNNLRRFYAGDKEFKTAKAVINAENFSDKLLEEISSVEPGSGGQVVKDVYGRFIGAINERSGALFQQAEQSVERGLEQGKLPAFYDIKDLWKSFQAKTFKEASENDKPAVAAFLSDLEKELNFTKLQVVKGEIPVNPRAAQSFASDIRGEMPLDTAIFGPNQTTPTVSKGLVETFDPTKVTARDYNKAKNFIKDNLTQLDNPKYIIDKRTKKNITQFLAAFERPFSQNADEALDLMTASGVGAKDLRVDNPFLRAKVKVPANAKDFNNVSKGYSVRKKGFDYFPEEARKIINQADNPAILEDKLGSLDAISAKNFRTLIDNFSDPEEQLVFNTSVKAKLYNPSTGAGKKQIQRKSIPGASDEVLQQAQPTETLIEQGIKPKRSVIENQLIKSGTEALPTTTFVQGSRAANLLEGSGSPYRSLLGNEAEQTLSQAQELAGLQSASGVPQSAVDLAPKAGLPASTIDKLANPKSPNLISGALSLLGNVARPTAGGAADLLEMFKNATFAPAATVPNLGGYAIRNDTTDRLLNGRKYR